jgi:hypothetical protein
MTAVTPIREVQQEKWEQWEQDVHRIFQTEKPDEGSLGGIETAFIAAVKSSVSLTRSVEQQRTLYRVRVRGHVADALCKGLLQHPGGGLRWALISTTCWTPRRIT